MAKALRAEKLGHDSPSFNYFFSPIYRHQRRPTVAYISRGNIEHLTSFHWLADLLLLSKFKLELTIGTSSMLVNSAPSLLCYKFIAYCYYITNCESLFKFGVTLTKRSANVETNLPDIAITALKCAKTKL